MARLGRGVGQGWVGWRNRLGSAPPHPAGSATAAPAGTALPQNETSHAIPFLYCR